MTERIDAEINPTLGHGTQGHMDLFRASAAVVEQTRRAWVSRPDEFLPPDARIAVGIGFAAVTRGGWVVYEEDDASGTRVITVSEAEKMAERSPEQDWRIHLVSPGMERHYKRIGPGQWKLYRWGAGLGGSYRRQLPRQRIPPRVHAKLSLEAAFPQRPGLKRA